MLYLHGLSASYAEEEIITPKRDGQIWEVRVINEDLNRVNGRPLAMFAKLGGNGHVANRSGGGRGAGVEELVREAYTQIRPGEDDGTYDRLVAEYLGAQDDAAGRVIESLSSYLTQHMRDNDISFLFDDVVVDSASTDFMAHIVEGDEATLTPVLVDINLWYGHQGLEETDLVTSQTISLFKEDKARRIRRLIETGGK